MDLKKLKKESSNLTGEKKASSGKSHAETDNQGIKSVLKVNDYNNKYANDANVYQDHGGSKKYKPSSWKLTTGKDDSIERDDIDNIKEDKLKFLDENGDIVAMQG